MDDVTPMHNEHPRLAGLLRHLGGVLRDDGDHRPEAKVVARVHWVTHGAGDHESIGGRHGGVVGVLDGGVYNEDEVDLACAPDVRKRILDAAGGGVQEGLAQKEGASPNGRG